MLEPLYQSTTITTFIDISLLSDMAMISMVDQKLLRMQLEAMQTMRTLLVENPFRVKSGSITEGLSLLDLVLILPTDPSAFVLSLILQGEKNNGFDVLYHNMKHGQISSKELTDFIRER